MLAVPWAWPVLAPSEILNSQDYVQDGVSYATLEKPVSFMCKTTAIDVLIKITEK